MYRNYKQMKVQNTSMCIKIDSLSNQVTKLYKNISDRCSKLEAEIFVINDIESLS